MPELDFAVIKETARRLGITHRSDIKPETLQAKIDAHKPDDEAKKSPAPASNQLYKNITTQNIFTSAGRCKPGKSIEVSASEAESLGLESC